MSSNWLRDNTFHFSDFADLDRLGVRMKTCQPGDDRVAPRQDFEQVVGEPQRLAIQENLRAGWVGLDEQPGRSLLRGSHQRPGKGGGSGRREPMERPCPKVDDGVAGRNQAGDQTREPIHHVDPFRTRGVQMVHHLY